MKTLLWLDDVRDPMENDWLVFSPIGKQVDVWWVTNYDEFTNWITEFGLPDGICFDHDLGGDVQAIKIYNGMSKRQARRERRGTPTGHDCAKWLVEYCMDNNKKLPPWGIQSANPVGKENIDRLLTNFNEVH